MTHLVLDTRSPGRYCGIEDVPVRCCLYLNITVYMPLLLSTYSVLVAVNIFSFAFLPFTNMISLLCTGQ